MATSSHQITIVLIARKKNLKRPPKEQQTQEYSVQETS